LWQEEVGKKSWEGKWREFRVHAYKHICIKRSVGSPADLGRGEGRGKEPRLLCEPPSEVKVTGGERHLCQLAGDSLEVVAGLNGEWSVSSGSVAEMVGKAQDLLCGATEEGIIAPLDPTAEYARHVFRELNREADAEAL
jgi:hypothetical protein